MAHSKLAHALDIHWKIMSVQNPLSLLLIFLSGKYILGTAMNILHPGTVEADRTCDDPSVGNQRCVGEDMKSQWVSYTFQGYDLLPDDTLTFDKCQEACKSNPQCKSYVINIDDGIGCAFKCVRSDHPDVVRIFQKGVLKMLIDCKIGDVPSE